MVNKTKDNVSLDKERYKKQKPMKEVLINCEKIRSRKVLHDYLESELSLPDYYGRNLDALHDILATHNQTDPVSFRMINREKQSTRMVQMYAAMIDMLRELHKVNPNITLIEE
ncbi:MAG: barstar family protein [Clostridia bacterium]|nr:barstar family protein [Clostridia bacterium]